MTRKSSRAPRPSITVMEELVGERIPWDLDKHLNGCLAGYQTAPSYGTAVSALSLKADMEPGVTNFRNAIMFPKVGVA
jgi:hypothetical protein